MLGCICLLAQDLKGVQPYLHILSVVLARRLYVSQVKDSAMLSKIQGMVGTASPLGATVAQIRDRLTAVTR